MSARTSSAILKPLASEALAAVLLRGVDARLGLKDEVPPVRLMRGGRRSLPLPAVPSGCAADRRRELKRACADQPARKQAPAPAYRYTSCRLLSDSCCDMAER